MDAVDVLESWHQALEFEREIAEVKAIINEVNDFAVQLWFESLYESFYVEVFVNPDVQLYLFAVLLA